MAGGRTGIWPILAAGDGKDGKDGNSGEVLPAQNDDPLQLHNSDHPGAVLVTSPLTGNNYLTWSRAMRIALGAKTKLGFVNGKIPEPEPHAPNYEQWKRVDFMVTSWILNSISKDLVDAFIYADSAMHLWNDIAERFGECNGPLLYQLKKEITNMKQGNLPLTVYFMKLKKLWDELACLSPLPSCSCGTSKILSEKDLSDKLLQFLMGLNDSYDAVRSQILMLDPLPNVNKAYSMLLRVEKQRDVQMFGNEAPDGAAMMTKLGPRGRGEHSNRGRFNGWSNDRNRPSIRKSKEERAKLVCDHCQAPGHEMSECFHLHGYPDWYKQLKQQRAKSATANMINSESDKSSRDTDAKGTNSLDMSSLIQQEIAKYMSGKVMDSSAGNDSSFSFAHFVDLNYAGPED